MTPLEAEYREIQLTRGQVAIVDVWEYEALNLHKWNAWWNPSTQTFYAMRTVYLSGNSQCIYMHRQILGLSHGDKRLGDHKDRNKTLDNRWANLRYATRGQNGGNSRRSRNNTSGYKGVCWDKRKERWYAQIMVNREHIFLRYWDSKEQAYAAYCRAALKYFGEFARFE